MLYHGVTLGGTGKDVGKRHPTVREGALVSAHAQVIGPIEIGAKAKVGAGAVVVSDVPSDVTVVGVPAKIVRVHGKKDVPIIHQEEEKREYYMNKLEHAKDWKQRPLLPSVRSMTERFGILISPICSILIPICQPFSFITKKVNLLAY